MKDNNYNNNNDLLLLPHDNNNLLLPKANIVGVTENIGIENNNVKVADEVKNSMDKSDLNKSLNIVKEHASKDFELHIDVSDTLLTLTRNNSIIQGNTNNVISKIVIVRQYTSVNLNDLSIILGFMKIGRLNIFYIDNKLDTKDINYIISNNGSKVTYTEMHPEQFTAFLNLENNNFFDYNKHSLYIVRGYNYMEINNLFALINNCEVNLVRGGSQKAHVLSPLDFRLSSYLLAMFKFDYSYVSSLNAFNDLSKDRYLPYFGRD